MRKTKLTDRLLALLCVVMMLVMMLPISGFGEFGTSEEKASEPQTEVQPTVEVSPVIESASVAAEETAREDSTETLAEEYEAESSVTLDGIAPAAAAADVPMAVAEGDITVTFNLTGFESADQAIISKNATDGYDDYEVTLVPNGYHTLPESITIEVAADGDERELTLVGSIPAEPLKGDYTYDNGTGKITIFGDALTDVTALTITAEAVENDFVMVSYDLANITINGQSKGEEKVYLEDSPFEVELKAAKDYTLPSAIEVLGADSYSYEPSTGELSIPLTKDSDVTILADGVEDYYYEVTVTGANFGLAENSATKIYPTSGGTLTLAADDYYDLPADIELKIGNTAYSDGITYSDGTITIEENKLPVLTENGTLTISGIATETVYTVTITYADASITSITRNGIRLKKGETLEWNSYTDSGSEAQFQVTHSFGFEIEFEATAGKQMPESIDLSITHDYKTQNKGQGWFIQKRKTATLTVKSGVVGEDISVQILKVEPQEYQVRVISDNEKATNIIEPDSAHQSVKDNTAYSVVLSAEDGYSLPETIGITITDDMGVDTVLTDSEYSWNQATGNLTIPAEQVVGAITIYAQATLNSNGNYTITPNTPDEGEWYSTAVTIEPVTPATAILYDGKWYKGIVIGENAEMPAGYFAAAADCNNEMFKFVLGDGIWNGSAYTEHKTSAEASESFSVDTIAPDVVAGKVSAPAERDNVYYTNSTASVTFIVEDDNFEPDVTGIYEIIVAPEAPFTRAWTENEDGTWSVTVTLSSETADDGKYTVALSVKDIAGHEGSATSAEIVVDDTIPTVTGVAYTPVETDYNFVQKVLDKIFNIYKSDEVNVTVTASDALSPIDYFVITDSTGNVNYRLEATLKGGTYTATTTEGIPAQYKGSLVITAWDLAGNESDVLKPTVTGNTAENNTDLILDTVKPGIVFNSPDYSTVHNSAYSFTFTVTDDNTDNTSSGLESVTYQVFKYDSSSRTSSTSITAAVPVYTFASGDFKTGDTYTATIPLEGGNTTQNSNLVYVVVTAVDNAGNETVLSTYDASGKFFLMDNTRPNVSVSYDNDSAENSKYFKATRTATVTVVDKNFYTGGVTITTGGSVVSWSTGTDSDGDGLADTYTCQISYTSDDDYTLSIQAQDQGGNATTDSQVSYTGTATQDFTIDLTNPTYTVSFANGGSAVTGGNYSQGTVTATLSVVEHNFDSSAATAGVVVMKDGVDISSSISGLISWSSSGDTRTATFELPDDGEYSVDMSFVDLAGNNTAAGGINSVFVDQNDPVVKVTGVRNESANADDEIIPVVTISDKYYDAEHGLESITLLNGRGEDVTSKYLDMSGASAVTVDAENDTQTQTFTFKNITEDDIYRLVVVHTDLSGRQNSVMTVLNAQDKEEEFSLENGASERFSVNRNGSTYSANDETLAILGDYVQSATNVRIIETNVDELNPESIHIGLTHDSTSRDLANGTDFTYQMPPEEDESGWHVYEYVLADSLFEEDGVYTITVYSEDAAGNISQNNTAEKDFEIMFIVDKTAPIYVAMNLVAGEIYNEDEMTVTINASDNIALDEVHVYKLDSTASKDADGNYDWTNAEELEVTPVGENGDYTFVLREGASAATSKQSVLVVCTDKAGNQNEEQEILDFTVSSSFWIRYYANKPLFYGSIGGVLVVLGGVFIVFFRKKEEEEDQEEALAK